MENDVITKYKIHIINGKRFYEAPFDEEMPYLDGCIPHYFKYEDIEIENHSWGNLIVDILESLNKKYPKDRDELINFRYGWSRQSPLSIEKKTNHKPCLGLYVNVNFSTSQLLNCIKCFLTFYNIDFHNVTLLIHRSQMTEPEECRTYFRSQTVNAYSKFLKLRGYNQLKRINQIKNINVLNKYLGQVNTVADDLFLSDDFNRFYGLKESIRKACADAYITKPEAMLTVDRTLSSLTSFFRNRPFFEWLDINKITGEVVELIDNLIQKLFKTLKSDFFTMGKFYSVAKLAIPNTLQILGEFNNESNFFALVESIFCRKYYFRRPYISQTEKAFGSSKDLVYSYAYSMDFFNLSDINKYCDEMHFARISNYKELLENASAEYLLVENFTFVRSDNLGIDKELIDSFSEKVEFVIKSYGPIDTTKVTNYSVFYTRGKKINKFTLLGLILSYLTEKFEIDYILLGAKDIEYRVSLKSKN